MTVDEFELRQLARDLIKLYAAMDELKHIPMKPPEVRTMQNTGGKPSMPGNWLWMHRSVDMEQKLREVAMNAFSDIQVRLRDDDAQILNLLELIALNAHAISELPWADDFCDELTDQARTIGKWVNPPEPKEVAKRLEPYHRAEVIIQRAAQHGHALTRDGLRKLAERSQKTDHPITTEQYGGRTTYRFTEVLAYLTRKATNHE